jgi:hypothetical protein
MSNNNPATSKPHQAASVEGRGLIQSTYGASNLPLDFLSGASGKFWRTDDVSAEEVIAAAQALDLDAMRQRRSRPVPPPPAAHTSPPGPAHDQEKESKKQRTTQHIASAISK